MWEVLHKSVVNFILFLAVKKFENRLRFDKVRADYNYTGKFFDTQCILYIYINDGHHSVTQCENVCVSLLLYFREEKTYIYFCILARRSPNAKIADNPTTVVYQPSTYESPIREINRASIYPATDYYSTVPESSNVYAKLQHQPQQPQQPTLPPRPGDYGAYLDIRGSTQ